MPTIQKLLNILTALGLLSLVSCSSNGSNSGNQSSEMTQSMEERIKGGYEVGTDEHGNPKMQSERRSQFENTRFGGASATASVSNYSKKEYSRTRWSGQRSYDTENYGGNTRARGYDKSPHFIRKNAHLAKNSRFSRKAYTTEGYRTGQSSEQGRTYRTGTNAYTENRRNKRPKDIITTYQQEQQMSVEDTNALLGR